MLFAAGRELLASEIRGETYRLIGIGLSDLADVSAAPTDFFSADEQQARETERVIDDLRTRFGKSAIVSGRSLKPH
jgi:DNA polymerase-4